VAADTTDASEETSLQLAWILLATWGASTFLVVLFALQLGWRPAFAGALWSLALTAVGAVPGFLFGLPRVHENGADISADAGSSDAKAPIYRPLVNDSLAQISDWLTKALVGISLVELGTIKSLGLELAESVRGSLGECAGAACTGEGAKAAAVALVIFYPVFGFLGIYLATRLYLGPALAYAESGVLGRLQKMFEKKLADVSQTAAVVAAAARNPVTAPAREGYKNAQEMWESDPHAGYANGQSAANGYTLSAAIQPAPQIDNRANWIDLRVTSSTTVPSRTGSVRFLLHPTFARNVETVQLVDGAARLQIVAWGYFTVGAQVLAPDGRELARLELNLHEIPGGVAAFYEDSGVA